jgi:hypothetical protein
LRRLRARSGKRKGPLVTERPKSREETPKEGCEASGSSHIAPQKLKVQRITNKCILCKAAAHKMRICPERGLNDAAANTAPPYLAPVRKKAVRESNGPSLGRKRPNRAATTKKRVSAVAAERWAASATVAISTSTQFSHCRGDVSSEQQLELLVNLSFNIMKCSSRSQISALKFAATT